MITSSGYVTYWGWFVTVATVTYNGSPKPHAAPHSGVYRTGNPTNSQLGQQTCFSSVSSVFGYEYWLQHLLNNRSTFQLLVIANMYTNMLWNMWLRGEHRLNRPYYGVSPQPDKCGRQTKFRGIDPQIFPSGGLNTSPAIAAISLRNRGADDARNTKRTTGTLI